MNCLVTGAAGFIGSHLCKKLLNDGHTITGIDVFTDYYPKWIKEENIAPLLNNKRFNFLEENINDSDLKSILPAFDNIIHLAAQAGVRASWGNNFTIYTKNNIEATQRLLEAAKEIQLNNFIYASSSSVYGFCPELPMKETSPLFPYSPYGVSKLAGENLCSLYYKNYNIPTISLRFFTVYGPGQRPDMAFHKLFLAAATNKSFPLYGDGTQTRDFTYIDDIVRAILSAVQNGKPGEIYNLGGGNRIALKDIIPILEKICQKKVQIERKSTKKGDVPHTFADISKAKKDLNYSPQMPIEKGLEEEWIWMQKLYRFV